jgi:hypothetical protein
MYFHLHCNSKSDIGSDRCRHTQGFLTKNVKEIFWDLNFLSEVTGCRKTQVSVLKILLCKINKFFPLIFFWISDKKWMLYLGEKDMWWVNRHVKKIIYICTVEPVRSDTWVFRHPGLSYKEGFWEINCYRVVSLCWFVNIASGYFIRGLRNM